MSFFNNNDNVNFITELIVILWELNNSPLWWFYRGVNKGLHVFLSGTQAEPGQEPCRTVKQEQEEISHNHVQTFIYPSVLRIEKNEPVLRSAAATSTSSLFTPSSSRAVAVPSLLLSSSPPPTILAVCSSAAPRELLPLSPSLPYRVSDGRESMM